MDRYLVQQEFHEVLGLIRQSRQKVFSQANTALIDLYWHIGQMISHKVQHASWGKGVVTELAHFIAQNDPEIKGFSDKNLWRMKQFFETYQSDKNLWDLLKKLPWTHNTIIFSRCKTAEERQHYLKVVISNQLTKRELERQIDSSHFERSMVSAKLSPLVRELRPGIEDAFKDSYVLEFLGLPAGHTENHLQKALVRHMKQFIDQSNY